jgi:hypothetical protein
MRRLLLLSAAAIAIAAAAPGQAEARHTLAHRVATLEAKVAALQTKVNRLHTFTHNCIGWGWAALAVYGDWEAGEFGYFYDNGDGSPPFLTTALDLAPAADAHFFVPILRPSCRGSVAAVNRLKTEVDALAEPPRPARRFRPL